MKPWFEQIIDLLQRTYDYLSDEYLAWDTWALEWQKNTRNRPSIQYTTAVWQMTRGYLDALRNETIFPKNKTIDQNMRNNWLRRAEFRERICNLSILALKISSDDKNEISVDTALATLSKDISSLQAEIVKYFA